MPLKSVLARLLGRPRRARAGPIVVDFSSDAVVLPSGKVITTDMIIAIDTQNGVIVYRDLDGSIREESLRKPGAQAQKTPPEQPGAPGQGTVYHT